MIFTIEMHWKWFYYKNALQFCRSTADSTKDRQTNFSKLSMYIIVLITFWFLALFLSFFLTPAHKHTHRDMSTHTHIHTHTHRWDPHDVVAKRLDCNIVVSKCYYIYFRTNTLRKGMNLLIFDLWFKYYHYCSSTMMALTLNKPWRLICHLTKKPEINPYLPSYGLNSITFMLLQEWLWHSLTLEGWCAIKQRNRGTDTYTHKHTYRGNLFR